MAQVIKVGIIGLSANTSSGTAWAANAHLPYLVKSPKYEIVALQNTSVESAQKAIAHYDLPSSTKAYGTPEDLAKDENVDLVVSSVRVDAHASTIAPAIRAGKDVYVEWPLGGNLAEAVELAALAKQRGVASVVGLESRFTPIVQVIKSIIRSGRIGDVKSSSSVTIDPDAGAHGRKHIDYFAEREVGGNPLTVYFGHAVEYMTEALGSLKSLQSVLSTQYPVINIIDGSGAVVEKDRKRTSHDNWLLSGTLVSGALFSYEFVGGPLFPGSPAFSWTIRGSKGEIRVASDSFHIFVHPGNMRVQVFDFASGEVGKIPVEEDGFMGLPSPARTIGRLYDAFWESKFGKGKGKGKVREYRDFEDAVKWHRLIDGMYAKYDAEHVS